MANCELALRLAAVQERIARAAEGVRRDPAGILLLAVTKIFPAETIRNAYDLGLRDFGENYVQEFETKAPELKDLAAARFHFVGHLQSNKSKLAVQYFDLVQSVDSEKLLNHLDRAAAELGKVLPVLLQINAGNDPAKFGADLADAPRLVEIALTKKNLRVDGLMTIAPLGATPDETAAHAQRTFANLRLLRDDLAARFATPLRELSMGMTADLALAVAAGSTMVRVGTALYGTREAPPP